MSHILKDKAKITARVRRLRGQMEAVERALDSDAECGDVLMQLSSIRGALNGLVVELLGDQLQEHVVAAPDDEQRQVAANELIQIFRSYVR